MIPDTLWHDTLPEGRIELRPALEGRVRADVAIVGAGYTGLWAAHALATLEPTLDVHVVEARFAGFGASGRNGGWASQEFAIDRRRAAARHGRDAVAAQLRAVADSIDEIGRTAAAEGIDCDFEKGGSLTYATSPAHLPRIREMAETERSWGFGEEEIRLLDREEAMARARMAGALGAYWTRHCAAIHPAKLARGLAEAVERKGVRIWEASPAVSIEPGVVRTERGAVEADAVLRCTEAFTVGLPGERRRYVPVYSLMIATEPLPSRVWDEIGLEGRPTFHDARHLVVYGQRTADGRFAFGGRGAPYHFGSAIRPEFDHDAATHEGIAAVLRELFPQIGDAAVTHRWGGPVALSRDLNASVGFDRATRTGWAGGYAGAGVTTANLAGRTLADLVLGRDTDLVGLPWVGHRSRRWEPEPLRWAGVNLGRRLAVAADAVEARTGRPSRMFGGALHRLMGH